MDIAPEDKLLRLLAPAPSLVQHGDDRVVRLGADLKPIEGVLPCGGGLVSGVALYVTAIADGGASLGAPPDVAWALRARFGRYTEEVTSGVATWPDDWSSRGLLVQVANRLCEGFELHARAVAGGDVLVRLRWMVTPGSLSGLPSVQLGVL